MFDNVNKIKVTFSLATNGTRSHFDNTLTVLSSVDLTPGTLLSFVDPLKTKDKNYLYSNSLMVVYPSLYEGFGIPVLESLPLWGSST